MEINDLVKEVFNMSDLLLERGDIRRSVLFEIAGNIMADVETEDFNELIKEAIKKAVGK